VRFTSPLQKIAHVAEGARVDRSETIHEYALPPWEPRLRPRLEADRGKAVELVNKASGIVIATGSSEKKGMVGMGGIGRDTLFSMTSETVANYSVTLGTREEQNPYTAELAAIARALESVPAGVCHRHITIITRNQSALAVIRQPRQQSGQGIIRQIYHLASLHQQRGNSVDFLWIPAEGPLALRIMEKGCRANLQLTISKWRLRSGALDNIPSSMPGQKPERPLAQRARG
jgi:ribonuclease HI